MNYPVIIFCRSVDINKYKLLNLTCKAIIDKIVFIISFCFIIKCFLLNNFNLTTLIFYKLFIKRFLTIK